MHRSVLATSVRASAPQPAGSLRIALTTILVAAALAVAAPALAADLAVGDPAPDFALAGSDGKTYRLADFRGRQAVVIAWFPMAFTSGCTIECKSLADDGGQIEQYDVTYFMASVDPVEGEKGNRAFAKAHAARFPILSDPTKQTATAYGVLSAGGYANRWTFYVAKDGRIAHIDKDVSSRLATSALDMAKKLGELGVPKKTAK
ncbi:MAG: redoxin domain-containing protein [Deltaproteobacteria bacterium]|nr:redoxin domain-containing protein [Deltaproteobacteria bacterium]